MSKVTIRVSRNPDNSIDEVHMLVGGQPVFHLEHMGGDYFWFNVGPRGNYVAFNCKALVEYENGLDDSD